MIKGLVIDKDGVLVNSEPLHTQAWLEILPQHGIDVQVDWIMKYKGMVARDVAMGLCSDAGIEPTVVMLDRLIADRSQAYRKIADISLQNFPDTVPFLRSLSDAGYPLAIATSGSRTTALADLELVQLLPYFKSVVTGSDVSLGKPHPEIFLTAARHLEIDPSNCLGIEDSKRGIEAVKSAGMICIAVATTYGKDELSKADVVVDKLSDISINLIRRL